MLSIRAQQEYVVDAAVLPNCDIRAPVIRLCATSGTLQNRAQPVAHLQSRLNFAQSTDWSLQCLHWLRVVRNIPSMRAAIWVDGYGEALSRRAHHATSLDPIFRHAFTSCIHFRGEIHAPPFASDHNVRRCRLRRLRRGRYPSPRPRVQPQLGTYL